jgi:protein phosphatase
MTNIGQVHAYLQTDPGLVRDHNEDFVTHREPTDPQDEQANGWIYIVADGVGGADAGEVASQYASQQMLAHYLNNAETFTDWGARLVHAMQAANTDLRRFVAERNNNSRMATTMVAAVVVANQVFIGNVGDSRGYLWRQGILEQITKDQSLVAKLVEEGAITEEEALNHPRKHVILYSLGSEKQPKIELFTNTLQSGDILLLCSDGLNRHVSDPEIAQIIDSSPADSAAIQLIDLAKERGGEDNISVALICYRTAEDTAVTPTPFSHSKQQTTVSAAPVNHRVLWMYTGLLTLILVILIMFSWIILRI